MRILIQNAAIIDVAAGRATPDSSLVLQDSRIETCNASRDRKGAVTATILDARGLFACPGLIDCHTHLFLDAGPDPRGGFLATTDDRKLATAAANAAIALRAGITTVRDCGAPANLIFAFRDRIERGEIPGPRVLACGSPLTRPAGHCHFFGIEVSGPDDVRLAIEVQVGHGASFVKLIASGGGLTPGTRPAEPDLPLQSIRAAVQAAHRHGIYVTAHCHATESILRCLTAGVDIIEHASFLKPDGSPEFDPQIAREIRAAGAIVCPTVISGTRIAESIRRNGHRNGDDGTAVARLDARRLHTARFLECGVEIIAGTDCGVTNTPFDSLADELAGYVQSGMTPAQALRTATCDAARHLRRPDLGRLEPGAAADILLLRENPLLTIDALRHPVVVIKSGKIVCDSR